MLLEAKACPGGQDRKQVPRPGCSDELGSAEALWRWQWKTEVSLHPITGDGGSGRSLTTPHPSLPGTLCFHRNMPRKENLVADQALSETVVRSPHLLPPVQLVFPQLPSYLNQNLAAAALRWPPPPPAALQLISQMAESASVPLHRQVASASVGDHSSQIWPPRGSASQRLPTSVVTGLRRP